MYMKLYAVFKNGEQITPAGWDKASYEHMARRYRSGAKPGEQYEVRQVANG